MIIRAPLEKIDRGTIRRWNERGFTAGHLFANPDLELLKTRLLSIAGQAVCLPWQEEDLELIMKRGELWRGYKALMCKGEPCQCHGNSASLYVSDPRGLTICTGYGMSHDGMWRQHSWCLRKRDNRVIETTTRRILYFGFRMTRAEADKFWEHNWL